MGGPHLEVRQREVEVGWAGLANWAGAVRERKEGGRRRWVGLEGEREGRKFFFQHKLYLNKSIFLISNKFKFGCYTAHLL